MGAIELQVFVSLVVVLGAAFVALICDFLKGNIEQLRESNIEFRVRQDEREKREELIEKVQRQTIETLVQARVAPVPAAAGPVPPVRDEQPNWAVDEAQESREMFERSHQERLARRREGRLQQSVQAADPVPTAVPQRVATPDSILPTGIAAFLPHSGLSVDIPTYRIEESPVVRIRVLDEIDALLAALEPIELTTPIMPVQTLPLIAAAEPIISAEPTSSLPVARIEPISFAAPAPRAFANLEHTAPAEIRSNVVAMPAVPLARSAEQAQPLTGELAIPGGFHPAPVLARLLEEETPFHGLAIVISVVDYVRLMAEEGKPAADQLMGSVTRLVISLAREQDFACRIAEDEFILLYSRETGAGAKRRIQQVSERLWDFQLRSLGSVSVIFSWGASESTQEAVVHAVEYAREQMLESRRNRRALASGIGRFRRRTGND